MPTLASESGHRYRFRMNPANTDWEKRYQTGDTPWDTGLPCAELVKVLDEYAIPPGRVCEFGCGTGTDSVYLASRGFDVTGIDFSATALAAAEERRAAAGVKVRFMQANVLQLPDLGAPFPFMYDRGCFHVVRQIDEAGIVAAYQRLLAPGGRLLIFAGNAKEQCPADQGPPRVSEDEMRRAFAGFTIEHLREFRLETQPGRNFFPLAWSMLVKKA